ncbi:MAG: hypothetical protein ABIJ44_03435 [Pseudomonadota bacterium]
MGKKKEVDDRFKKFGTVSFTSISKVNDFIDYMEKGKVMHTRCKDCGLVFFPPEPIVISVLQATWNGLRSPETVNS